MSNFLLVLLLLGVGAFVTERIRWLSRFRIPPSLTMGLIALGFFTALPAYKQTDFFVHLQSLPREFIALVFACLFLQRTEKQQSSQRTFSHVIAEVSLVWVSVMGQVLIGIVGTVLVYRPFFGEPMAFASVLETGFAGGHGTAVAMGPLLTQNGIAAGLEYGLFSATVGLVCGIAGGVWLIHRQRRHIHNETTHDAADAIAAIDLGKILVALALIAAAYWLGIFYKGIVEHEIVPLVGSEKLHNVRMPLFAYTLVGGLSLKFILRLAGLTYLIENQIILLLADVFLEILIFAGIAIINVRLLGQSLVPLLTLFAFGFFWNLFCHFKLRPKILPVPYSFELGVINFGMLNGTAATGLMLLKMIDPKFKTPAARVFAESSAITQPFIAGGILTLVTPFIVSNIAPYLSLALYGGLLAVWLTLGLWVGKKIER